VKRGNTITVAVLPLLTKTEQNVTIIASGAVTVYDFLFLLF
jgi:hypothetical protein